MPQSLSAVYVHLVFSTKDRRPFLRDQATRSALHAQLGGISKSLECPPLLVGGVEDHVHMLCRFGRTITQAIMLSRPFIQPDNPRIDPPNMVRKGLPDALWGITYIGKALYGVADLLAERPSGDRMIIMLTDGESSDIKSPKDQAIIAALRAQNITVFAIMMCEEQIEPALVGIARATGGDVFNAATPEALHAVFKSIDEMKKVVVLQKQPQASDYYDPFFLPAMVLLGLSVLAMFGLRFTPW
ncbi:MAG: VWA domain-containing protein [Limisphaerales bacterium]